MPSCLCASEVADLTICYLWFDYITKIIECKKKNDDSQGKEVGVVAQNLTCGICHLETPEDNVKHFAANIIASLIDNTQYFAMSAVQPLLVSLA